MGGWITMKVTLHESQEVERMVSILGLDRYQVVGRLHKIWSWAFQHTKKGGQSTLDKDAIDRKVDARGFAAAMIDVGWGRETSVGFKFEKFGKNNTTEHELRAEWAAKKRAQRKAREAKMSTQCPPDVPQDKMEQPKPHLTQPNPKSKYSSSRGARTLSPETPQSAAAAAEIQPSEEEKAWRQKAEAMVAKRPWWLPESRDWLGHQEAAEVVALLWSLPQVNGEYQGSKVWKEIIVAAEKGKRLENPAGFVLASVRKRCGVKKAGGAA